MSRDASISLDFGDGEHRFRLAIGQLRELQEKLAASPGAVLKRLIAYEPMADDAREVLRIGLVGGGMPPADALSLVRRYVDARPLIEPLPIAVKVLQAALFGVPDEKPGKSSGDAGPETPPPTES